MAHACGVAALRRHGFAAGLMSVTASADIVNGWDSGLGGRRGQLRRRQGVGRRHDPGGHGRRIYPLVFINSHTIANNIALDVSKPITLTYSTKSTAAISG